MRKCEVCKQCFTAISSEIEELIKNGQVSPSVKIDCASCQKEVENEENCDFTEKDWYNFNTACLGW